MRVVPGTRAGRGSPSAPTGTPPLRALRPRRLPLTAPHADRRCRLCWSRIGHGDLDVAGPVDLDLGQPDVGAVVHLGQRADQVQPAGGADHHDVEDAVGDGGVRRDPHARAVAAGVRDHDRRGAHLERGAVEDEGVRRGGERRERTHRGIGVLQPPWQPVRPVHQLGGVRVDAGVRRPGHHAGAAVRQAELDQVDRGRSARQQHPGHLGGVVGEAEHPGEVVAAAGRHDAERPAQRGHLAGDGRQHPVAADRDHDVAAVDGRRGPGRGWPAARASTSPRRSRPRRAAVGPPGRPRPGRRRHRRAG